MTAIVLDKTTPPPTAAGKSGDNGYDRCPTDDCIETDFSFKNGGRDAKGSGHYDWFTYFADPRQGGCGTNWARDTKQGAARRERKGMTPPKWKTASAQKESYTSVPSDAFRDNYERIFGHT